MTLPIDHDPDAGAPRYRLSSSERLRFAVLTVGTLTLAGGIVLAVAELLPVIPGWVLPTVLALLTALFLVLGRRAAARGATAGARAWAGWSGATVSFALGGFVSLAGLGGALVAVLLVAVVGNVLIALWFRSPVHFVVAQVAALAWGVVAHVFGITPWALLVAALAGLWWLRRVGVARSVVVTTTVLLPVAVTLLVHPLTHVGAAVDGADVAVLTGAVAVALTCMAVVGRAPGVTTVWTTARRTAVVVLVAQVTAGAVPAVGSFLAPASPWTSELLAWAAVLACSGVVVALRTRVGIVTVLVLCAVQLAEIAAALTLGPLAATTVGSAGLLGIAVAALVRRGHVLAWAAVLVVPALWAVLVALPTLVVAAVLVVSGAVVAGALAMGGRR